MLSNTFGVGRFTCTLTFDGAALRATWTPRVPKRLDDTEITQHRAGRDALMAEIIRFTGKTVLVLE
jgi:hypothetical protein